MKILGGEASGMNLFCPQGFNTRPMVARVKASLFNILADRIEESSVFDLFAGSGALGLEALSRGAAFCHFVERERSAVECLRRNVEKARFPSRSRVISGDVFRVPEKLGEAKFDICFFDPPYRLLDEGVSQGRCLEFLSNLARRFAARDAIVAIHSRPGVLRSLPAEGVLSIRDSRQYGSTELTILEVADVGISQPGENERGSTPTDADPCG